MRGNRGYLLKRIQEAYALTSAEAEREVADWQHYKPLVCQRWAKITAADLDIIAGRRELLAAHIQQTYGISKNTAQMQLESWQGQQIEPGAT